MSGREDQSPTLPQDESLIETLPERAAMIACSLAIVAMLVIIWAEVLLRKFFNYSLDAANELGGYMVVAIAFFSLSACQVRGYFHRVELIQQRLSPRYRVGLLLLFDLLSLVFMLILVWQLGRLVLASWTKGFVSISALFDVFMTPLWIPQLVMPVGAALLCYTLIRTIISRTQKLFGGDIV